MSRAFLLLCAFTISLRLGAQPPQYPQGYFRNPLRIPILLAGNFGECRPGHFHSGLDIKTNGHEGEPVYAAADGYVSRIKMEPGGFGHGLYITHPNGYTTLYAHLSDFVPRIRQYVRAQQYAKESWTVDLQFGPEQFAVKKGEQIAWSGNTGGSTAPHLHFEIRDSKTEHPLNPQLFGFDIKDTKAPVPAMLAVYDAATGIYNQEPRLLPLKKSGDVYRPANDTVEVRSASVPVGIVAADFMDGSENTLAFQSVAWYLDDALQGRILLNDIGYDATRYLHAYADYKTKQRTGNWVQLLYRLPGNRLGNIYPSLNEARGALRPIPGQPAPVRIELTDDAGNTATISFVIKATPGAASQDCPATNAWPAGASRAYTSTACTFTLDDAMLYDDVCGAVGAAAMPGAASDRFSILSADVPAHHYFPLRLHTRGALPFAARNKIAMMHSDGKEASGSAATAEGGGGWYTAGVRAFGDFWLQTDTTAPVLKPGAKIAGNMSKATRIAIHAADVLTSVKSFRGEIDGHWVLFEQHEQVWTYVFDAHCGKGAHRLAITATDENGNTARLSANFTR